MPSPKEICSRFVASTRGVAAIEFAAIMPVLLLLLLGTFDAGRIIAIYTKVRAATSTVDNVSNQYKTIHDSDMQQILGATSVVMSPYPSAPIVVVVSQISINAAGRATVSWSDALNGAARPVGSSVNPPAALATPNSTLIFGEVSYTYTPLFGYFLTGPITLSDNLYVTPRSSASITRVSP
jgi:Flp pilus assembly protein TadG